VRAVGEGRRKPGNQPKAEIFVKQQLHAAEPLATRRSRAAANVMFGKVRAARDFEDQSGESS